MTKNKSKFFTFIQNNSGGSFIQDDSVDHFVIIEANSPKEADELAQSKAGIYFDGINEGLDCSCCGDRWSKTWEEGSDMPSIYGDSINEYYSSLTLSFTDKESVHIYYLNGKHEKLEFNLDKIITKNKSKKRTKSDKCWFVFCNTFYVSAIKRGFLDEDNSIGYFDKAGNCGGFEKLGLTKEKDQSYFYFASENKKEVEQFVKGIKKFQKVVTDVYNEWAPCGPPESVGSLENQGVDAIRNLMKCSAFVLTE